MEKKAKKTVKSAVKKRTTNPPDSPGGKRAVAEKGAPANEQDSKRRLGHFVGAGEPARTGRRGQ